MNLTHVKFSLSSSALWLAGAPGVNWKESFGIDELKVFPDANAVHLIEVEFAQLDETDISLEIGTGIVNLNPTPESSQATSTLLVSGVLTAGDTVTLGAITYTAGTAGAGKIPIGGNKGDQATKIAAVLTGNDGLNSQHPTVDCLGISSSGDDIAVNLLSVIPGAAGNSQVTLETSSNLSFPGGTFSGGSDGPTLPRLLFGGVGKTPEGGDVPEIETLYLFAMVSRGGAVTFSGEFGSAVLTAGEIFLRASEAGVGPLSTLDIEGSPTEENSTLRILMIGKSAS